MLQKITSIDVYIRSTLITVSDSSKRIYEQTYRLWSDWCHNHQTPPVDFAPTNIMQFLIDQPVTKATRQRQLSAMRKLVQIAIVFNPTDELRMWYDILKMAKAPKENLVVSDRNLNALTPDNANLLLKVWSGVNPTHARNRALIAVLLSTGLRRSEAVALRWSEVDLDNGVIKVLDGKGGKDGDVSLVGDYAPKALAEWQALNPCDHVFPPMDNRDNITADEPMSSANLYRLIKFAEKTTSIAIAPHTMRRTLATELLAQGASVADVQAQLRHSQPSTTLRYAKGVDATQRRKRFKTRYGD